MSSDPGAAPMTPTDKDREAAEAARAWCDDMNEPEMVQAFMRHRLAAEERGARMALEAAAKVADEFPAYTEDRTTTPARTFDDGDWCPERTTITRTFTDPKDIATAIRQIDPAALGAE